MIPKTAEYALRAVVVLARDPPRSCSADQIARSARVPRRYAHKVLPALGRARFARSQSGPGGGYARLRRCPLGLKSHTSICPLHGELDDACAAMEKAFGRVTIAQVLDKPWGVSPLCELERGGRDGGTRARRRVRSGEMKLPAPRRKDAGSFL